MPPAGDSPIDSAGDDLLGRDATARVLADELRALDASKGYVVAVTGPWGSGKTSLLNLTRLRLSNAPALPVVEFNPWLFSGAEQLVEAFFRELVAQMRTKSDRLATLAAEMEAYGDLLSPLSVVPFVGAWFERLRGAAAALRKYQERRQGSVGERRAKLAARLAELDSPLVVVIDDIDRLRSDEVRDLFKLVRLTANFPNIVYVLAFDRARVETALGGDGIDGRAYLEKIVQLAVELPEVPEELLLRQVGEALDEALEQVGSPQRFSGERWPDVLMEIIWPLIRTMRDVRRYTSAVRATVRALGDQVEIVDVLALEAVRLFLPDLFGAVKGAQSALTTTASFGLDSRDDSEASAEAIQAMLAAAGSHEVVARALVERIFPAADRHLGVGRNTYGREWLRSWLRERRVAHPDVLRLYLEQVAGDGMRAFTDAERAYALLSDDQALDGFLRQLEPARLQDVVAALETFEGQFPSEAVVPAATVLLNLLPEMPERRRGMLDIVDARLVVVRVILRLLRQLPGPSEVETAVLQIDSRVRHLASRLELIRTVGHEENVGHKLVGEEAGRRLQEKLADDVRAAAPGQLREERDVLRLLLTISRWFPEAQSVVDPNADPSLNVALLLAARTEVRSQVMGARAVHREQRLIWDGLVEIFGTETQLRVAIDSLRNLDPMPPEVAEVTVLADRYLSGWRPSDPWDEAAG